MKVKQESYPVKEKTCDTTLKGGNKSNKNENKVKGNWKDSVLNLKINL